MLWPHLTDGTSDAIVFMRLPGDRGQHPIFIGDETRLRGVHELLQVTGLESVRPETQHPGFNPTTALFLPESLSPTHEEELGKGGPMAKFPLCPQVQGHSPQHTHRTRPIPLYLHILVRGPFPQLWLP